MSIALIHQNVFDFLMEYHENDKKFFFSLRQLNRSGRLDKGYWFLGNDSYLSVSFWMGSDNSTKSPRATFIIPLNGFTYLEVNTKYDKKPFFSLNFLESIGFKNVLPNELNRKYYEEFRDDYLASLKAFLTKDKLKVDDYLHQQLSFLAEDEIIPDVEFIWPGTFEKQLRIVRKYQEMRKNKEKKTGYLRNFKIHNFGPIKNLTFPEIPQGCKWVFLTGENGAGKTSVLRALAASICNNNDHGIEIASDNNDFETQIGMEAIDGILSHTVSGKDGFKNKNWLTKGFASYGPVRLINEGSLSGEWKDLDKNRISRRATLGLFSPIQILRDISGSYVLNIRPKYYQMTLDDFLENIEKNLQIILPNIQKVKVYPSGEGNRILYYQNSGKNNLNPQGVEFEHLPSGTRNFAGLILDLLLRFAEQQESVVDISDYVGVVLIDEIDLHLHPKMQKEIIIQLTATFPNIQFIVTTHSPIPLLGAPKDSVFINICRDEENRICASKINIDITNMLPNSILTSPIFNFDELINENHNDNDPLMSEDDYNEAVFYRILEKKIRERDINPQA